MAAGGDVKNKHRKLCRLSLVAMVEEAPRGVGLAAGPEPSSSYIFSSTVSSEAEVLCPLVP